VFRHVSASHLRNVFCLNLAFLAYRKNYISVYIWPSSSIQTVKCSLLDEKIVYRSFYGVPLTFSSFLLQRKVLFCTRRQVALARYLSSQAFRRLCRKNYISGYIWHRSFIHTVKCSFSSQITVIQSFLGALLTLVQKNRGFACKCLFEQLSVLMKIKFLIINRDSWIIVFCRCFTFYFNFCLRSQVAPVLWSSIWCRNFRSAPWLYGSVFNFETFFLGYAYSVEHTVKIAEII